MNSVDNRIKIKVAGQDQPMYFKAGTSLNDIKLAVQSIREKSQPEQGEQQSPTNLQEQKPVDAPEVGMGTPQEVPTVTEDVPTEIDSNVDGSFDAALNPNGSNDSFDSALGPDESADFSGGLGGTAEVAGTMLSSTVAEPLAGLAGMRALLHGKGVKGAEEAIDKVRTGFTYIPKSEEGKKKLEGLSDFMKPIAEGLSNAEKFLGDEIHDATGSPALAAAATLIPTIAMDLIGVGLSKGVTKAMVKSKNVLREGKIARHISDAVPDSKTLKETASAMYDEIASDGATLTPAATNKFVSDITDSMNKAGYSPWVSKAGKTFLKELEDIKGKSIPITELDLIRRRAKSMSTTDLDVGIQRGVQDASDNFMQELDVKHLSASNSKEALKVKKKYDIARDLYGRGKRSELIHEVFEKAKDAKVPFDDAIETGFRQLLNNKKTSKFFKPNERKMLQDVTRGTTKVNLARLLGKMGVHEGRSFFIPGLSIGASIGVFGPGGAYVLPAIGSVSNVLAGRLVRKGANFADQVIRAGKDAHKITEAYLKHTPKKMVSSKELSQLLMRPDIALDTLPMRGILGDAKTMALKNREILYGVAIGEGGAVGITKNDNVGGNK